VEPDRPASLAAGEGVDEYASAAEEHVPDATESAEAVVHVCCGGQELVFPDFDGLTLGQVQMEDMTHAVSAERNLAGTLGLRS